jgi:hypothetical protein
MQLEGQGLILNGTIRPQESSQFAKLTTHQQKTAQKKIIINQNKLNILEAGASK